MLIRLYTHYTILNQGFSEGHKRFFLHFFLFLLGLLFAILCLLCFALLCFVVCDLLIVGVPTTYFHVCEYQLSLLINCGTSAMRFRHVGVEISCLNQSWITKKLFHTTHTHPAVCPFLEGKIFFFAGYFLDSFSCFLPVSLTEYRQTSTENREKATRNTLGGLWVAEKSSVPSSSRHEEEEDHAFH